MQITMVIAISALVLVTHFTESQSKTLRAGNMTAAQWGLLNSGNPQNIVVEFRAGDEIPVSFSSEGDLLETIQTGVSYVKVKQSFWLRLDKNDIQMSLDGASFKDLKDMVSGSFNAGAGSTNLGIPINTIQMTLKANLK